MRCTTSAAHRLNLFSRWIVADEKEQWAIIQSTRYAYSKDVQTALNNSTVYRAALRWVLLILVSSKMYSKLAYFMKVFVIWKFDFHQSCGPTIIALLARSRIEETLLMHLRALDGDFFLINATNRSNNAITMERVCGRRRITFSIVCMHKNKRERKTFDFMPSFSFDLL